MASGTVDNALSMPIEIAPTKRAAYGAGDIPLAMVRPRAVFARVEDVPAYAWSLMILLTCFALLGWALVETGLIDREVDRGVQERIAAFDRMQVDVVERSAITKNIAEARQEGEFLKLMSRVQAIAFAPIAGLATVLLLPAAFYGLVALTGKKPEWHTLIAIAVYASFVDVLAGATQLGFMLGMGTLDVDTSAGALMRSATVVTSADATRVAALSGALSALDPFRVWFWWIVLTGLTATSQLRGWKAWAVCVGFWLAAAGVRTALGVAAVS